MLCKSTLQTHSTVPTCLLVGMRVLSADDVCAADVAAGAELDPLLGHADLNCSRQGMGDRRAGHSEGAGGNPEGTHGQMEHAA